MLNVTPVPVPGLFAIAVAVEVISRKDHTTCNWEVESMRKHLSIIVFIV